MSRPLYIRLAQRQSIKFWFSDILLLCGVFTTAIRSNAHALMYYFATLLIFTLDLAHHQPLRLSWFSQCDLLQGRTHLQTSQSWGFWPPCRCASESFLFRNQRDLWVLQKSALWELRPPRSKFARAPKQLPRKTWIILGSVLVSLAGISCKRKNKLPLLWTMTASHHR